RRTRSTSPRDPSRLLGRLAVLAAMAGCADRVEYLNFGAYRGDAEIVKAPDDTYPKYRVVFPEIPVDATGSFVFRVSGLPKAEYGFGLALPSGDEETIRSGIRARDVRCDVEIEGDPRDFIIHLGSILEARDSEASRDWSVVTISAALPTRAYSPNEMDHQ